MEVTGGSTGATVFLVWTVLAEQGLGGVPVFPIVEEGLATSVSAIFGKKVDTEG